MPRMLRVVLHLTEPLLAEADEVLEKALVKLVRAAQKDGLWLELYEEQGIPDETRIAIKRD